MSHNALISIVWAASVILNCGLVSVMVGKGSLQRFPFFGAYAVFTLLQNGLLYLVQGFHNTYFYAFWICEGVGLILGFAVVYEVFRRLLNPYPALRRLAFSIFQWSTLVLVLMGCVVLYAQSTVAQNRISAAVMVVEEATRIIEVGLLMFLFLFSTAFGLHWRQWVFGMALGLGIFATVALVDITVRNYWGIAVNSPVSLVRAIAFNISLIVWAGYLLVPEREANLSEAPHHGQLEQWNQVLTEFIYQ
jgi:hypothetical protein